MAKRKTNAERKQDRYEANRRAWEIFQPKLEAVQSYEEAKKLVAEGPGPDKPGRAYYSNLAFFLSDFTVPFDSNPTEKDLYIKLIQRFDAAGVLKVGTAQNIIEKLTQAIKDQGPW